MSRDERRPLPKPELDEELIYDELAGDVGGIAATLEKLERSMEELDS